MYESLDMKAIYKHPIINITFKWLVDCIAMIRARGALTPQTEIYSLLEFI